MAMADELRISDEIGDKAVLGLKQVYWSIIDKLEAQAGQVLT